MTQAEQDLAFISDKRVQLNAPGFIIDNNYYTKLNSTVDRAETSWNIGRFRQSLSSSNFGAQSTVIIPRSSMLRQVYLHLILPPIEANSGLCRGWGLASIADVSYLMGSANV